MLNHRTRHFAAVAAFLAVVLAIAANTVRADQGAGTPPKPEAALIAILQSDASDAEKAITCKQLAIYGSSSAVPELARLLSDKKLASWARIALEAIPGAAADKALQQAAGSLQGDLLIGVLNSIGVRRDASAVEILGGRLQDQDPEAASAAAVALGRIGNSAAAKLLQLALVKAPPKVRSAVAEGCVLCAERFLSENDSATAIAMYDAVRSSDVPRQSKLEATRGAILARKQEGIPLLLEQLRSTDKNLFNVALSTAREFPGSEVDQALASELDRTAPDRAALVILAMADRPKTVVLPAVLKAAIRGPKQVRIAAITSLGSVGNETCLAPLLEIALESDAELSQTAKESLTLLPGEPLNIEIRQRLAHADGKMYPLLIELVGRRRIPAVEELLKAIKHSDKTVRTAALISLGSTITPQKLPVLVEQLVTPAHPEDALVAQQALKEAAIRMPDREACATELAAALERSPVSTKSTLLEILGEVGGVKALEAVRGAAKSTDPQLQDIGSRILGKWMTIDAAPVLLELAKTGPGEKYQARALRGYLRITRQFAMSESQRIAMCRSALEACHQPADQKLVLDVLKRYPQLETIKLAVQVAEVPELKEEATAVALAISFKVRGKPDEVQSLLSKAGLTPVKLEILQAQYGAGATQKDVTKILQRQASRYLLILLPVSNYNASFGGDPAAGATKSLSIRYRVNGEEGSATFAENARIILPLPKSPK